MISQSIILNSGEILTITAANPRALLISASSDVEETEDANGELIGLNYKEEFKIEQGGTVKLGKSKYKIQIIERHFSSNGTLLGYYLRTFKRLTKSSNFLFPLLGQNRAYWRWGVNFVNCFCGTQEDADYGDSIYLLYRFNGTKEWLEFETKIQQHPWFSEMLETDKHHTMFKFDIPESHREDVELILKGKYSRISEKSKSRILAFHNSSKSRPLGEILYRSEKRRLKLEEELEHSIPKGLDLLDKFSIKEEIFMNFYIIEEDESETTTGSTTF